MRKIVVLEVLAGMSEPIRGSTLWATCNEDARFRKATGEEFWQADFADFMKGLVAQGVVAKLESRHRVWYVVTEKGILTLERSNMKTIVVGNIKRRLKFRLRRLLEYAVDDTSPSKYYFQELTTKIDELTGLLGQNGENIAKQLRYSVLVENYADLREDSYHYAEQHAELQKMESLVPLDDKLRERLEGDIAKFAARRRAAEERQRHKFDEEYTQKGFIRCFKCGNWVMREEALKLVKELKEHFAGIEVAAVCCSCYSELIKAEQLPVVEE